MTTFLRRLQDQGVNTTVVPVEDDDDDDDGWIIIIIVCAVIIALLLCCCCIYKLKQMQSKTETVTEVVEKVEEEPPTDKEEDTIAEPVKTEEEPEPHAYSTADVHNCTSTTCDLCRTNKGPRFLDVQTENVSNGLRVSGLPHRWWDRTFDEKKVKERLNKAAEDDEKVFTDTKPTALYQL